MPLSYWEEAARLDREETAASMERFRRLSQAAMAQFSQEFPGAPCLPGPPGHTVSFALEFEGTLLTVLPMPQDPCAGQQLEWSLRHPGGGTLFIPRKGAAGLYRACRFLCPPSVFEQKE